METDTGTNADGDIETEGYLAPATVAAARERYAEAVPTAKTATREATKAMSFDREEYERRVTSDVVGTVRDAVFASSLRVQVADRETFEAWADDDGRETVLVGHDDAPRVVWHAPGFADSVVAATFADEREAAVGTLRRQAFGRLYRGVVDEDDGADDGVETGDVGDAADGDGNEVDPDDGGAGDGS
ncbi:DUF5809 family protein [Halobaculum sp. MBLA0143]|uniref:DUF5809 family protein n=1 Tax=Halobaculum sp. MBLA0143 TaxID=3079933 RepID=UPI0035261ADE